MKNDLKFKQQQSTGVDVNGNTIQLNIMEFDTLWSVNVCLYATRRNLKSIIIPNNITHLYADYNDSLYITEFPESLFYMITSKETFDYNKCKVNVVNIYY